MKPINIITKLNESIQSLNKEKYHCLMSAADELIASVGDNKAQLQDVLKDVTDMFNKAIGTSNVNESLKLKEGKSISDFYTGFDAKAFAKYIEKNLGKHLSAGSVHNDNEYEFEMSIYDSETLSSSSRHQVAKLTYDKETRNINVQFFEYGSGPRDVSYGRKFTTKDVDEAINEINNSK